jgi:hypothetical protein
MVGTTVIGELARSPGFKGTANHKMAEPNDVRTLPPVDNTLPVGRNVRTSIDCYVSGQYVQKNGKIIEVKQRYTIFIGYNEQTLVQTMNDVRNRILSDFDGRYGKAFNVNNVYVPELSAPVPYADPEQMYAGSGLWRREVIPPHERMRYDISTEHLKAATNIKNIRERYKFRKQ